MKIILIYKILFSSGLQQGRGEIDRKICVTRRVIADCWKDSKVLIVVLSNNFYKDFILSVFVLDRRGKALMPCSQKRARKLLASGRACVVKLIPFVIRLKDRVVENSELQPITLKLEQGSKKTGDMIKAHITKGKKVGIYIGRVAVRANGYFNIQTSTGLIQGISHRYCHMIQRADGYGYFINKINKDSVLKEENQDRVKRDVLSRPALKDEVSRTIG